MFWNKWIESMSFAEQSARDDQRYWGGRGRYVKLDSAAIISRHSRTKNESSIAKYHQK